MIRKWELLLTNLTQTKIMVWKVVNSDYILNQSINSVFGLKSLENGENCMQCSLESEVTL